MKLEQLLKTASQECQLQPDVPILVGVSGGPDSLCLLDGLARLGFPLVVAHFDHQLRPTSAQDAEVVRAAAEKRGLPFVLGRADVSAYSRENQRSLEEAARVLRYRFLFEQARRSSAQAVAVGHTADDQVETVLMHLLRGSGLAGLKGMPFRSILPDWDEKIPLVRPLLAFWRAETLAYCQENNLEPVFDATNQDTIFLRNRVRSELVPLLETYNPGFRQNLWNAAQLFAGDEAVVQAAVQQAWDACQVEIGAGYALASLAGFQGLLPALQRGLLRRMIACLLPSLKDVDYASIERALIFTQAPGQGYIELAQGLRLSIEGDRLLLSRGDAHPPVPDWPQLGPVEFDLAVPGTIRIAEGWQMECAWVGREKLPLFQPGSNAWEAWLDADPLPGRLFVRRARPGDRFQPFGMQGHSLKLSDFWVNHKLPHRARAAWPLVCAGDTLVWVPGFRLAHPFRVQEHSQHILHLRLVRLR